MKSAGELKALKVVKVGRNIFTLSQFAMLHMECWQIPNNFHGFLYDFVLVGDEARVDDAQAVARLQMAVPA